MPIVNLKDLNHIELQSKLGDKKFSYSAVMSDLYGLKDLFVHHDIVPSGRKTSSSHSHSHREEMIFVIEGNPTLYLNDQTFELKKGDFIGIPAGEENFHFIENKSDESIHILVIASNPKQDIVKYKQ